MPTPTINPMPRRTPRPHPGARNGNMGRRSKLTPHTADAIINTVLDGNHLTTACYAAGITTAALHRWIAVANDIDQRLDRNEHVEPDALAYVEFRDRLAEARARAEMKAVKVVQTQMEGGYLISEEPVQDVNGDLVRDDEGEILYKRVYAQPDGRLALSYLAKSRPEQWGQNPTPQRIELTGADGEPLGVGAGGAQDAVGSLAARVAALSARAAAGDEDEVVEGEVVDEEGLDD